MVVSKAVSLNAGMMDTEAWNAIAGILSCVDHSRRPHASSVDDDPFGALHVLLFGDFKQTADRPNSRIAQVARLPPPFVYVQWIASHAVPCPFAGYLQRRLVSDIWLQVGTPLVGNDQMVNLSATWSKAPFIVVPWVVERFDFRVLRQNRRITAGTEDRRADGWWTLCAPTRPVHT